MVGQDQGLPERLGQAGDALADPVAPFLALQLGQGAGLVADQQVDQARRVRLSPAEPRRWSRLTVGCGPPSSSASTAWWVAIE